MLTNFVYHIQHKKRKNSCRLVRSFFCYTYHYFTDDVWKHLE